MSAAPHLLHFQISHYNEKVRWALDHKGQAHTMAMKREINAPGGMDWQVKPEVKRYCEFREMNLIEPWGQLPVMDVVFLRNVLIYFDVETKRQILGNVRKVLQSWGYLFLGGPETTINLGDTFERVQFDKAGCYRIKGS